MFDGNHRSRRQVNLSGRRRKATGRPEGIIVGVVGGGNDSFSSSHIATTSPTTLPGSMTAAPVTASYSARNNLSNKASILEESRRQRQERQLAQSRVRAARTIQKIFRRYIAQREIALDLENGFLLVEDSIDKRFNLPDLTTRLNFRLSLPNFTRNHSYFASESDHYESIRFVWCKFYASVIISEKQRNDHLPPCPLAHRIIQTVLSMVQSRRMDSNLCQTILQYCVSCDCVFVGGHAETEQKNLWRKLGGVKGFSLLVETIQYMLTTEPNNSFTHELWRFLAAVTPPLQSGQAMMGALVLSQTTLFYNKDLSLLFGMTPEVLYRDLFLPLVSVLTMPTTDDILVSAVKTIVGPSNHDVNICANALDLFELHPMMKFNPAPLMQLLHYVFLGRSDISFLSSLVARGDNIQMLLDNDVVMKENSIAASSSLLDDLSDDEFEDDTRVDVSLADSHQSQRRSTAARFTKQDLQTLPKINRLYQIEVSQWQREFLAKLNETTSIRGPSTGKNRLFELAHRIGNSTLWLTWGEFFLSTLQNSEDLSSARESYISMLAILLQTSTGLHVRQSISSPLLTKLALRQDFVEKLWRYVLMLINNNDLCEATYTGLSVFCDIFTHRLMGINDDQFLEFYTTMHGSRVILAEHLIVQLRDVLYQLYWSKPVRATDIRIPYNNFLSLSPDLHAEAVRGRLLITGTKLWNSLYERWCRLVRHSPFCDESIWLFPSLTSFVVENTAVEINRIGTGVDAAGSDNEDGNHNMTTTETENNALADAFSDPRMARILTCIPQALPFNHRVRLFHALLRADKVKTQDESSSMRDAMLMMMRGEEGEFRMGVRVEVHRENLYNDSMRQLNNIGPKLKKRVQVSFINQHGAREAGIDGGGVFKEFIDDLIKDAFSIEKSTQNLHLFTVTPLETLAVNSAMEQDHSLLQHYEFLGRVLGKAVYESILVEPQFCLPFLNQLLGKTNSLEDLKNFDPEYYRNLVKILQLSATDLESLDLTFELTFGNGDSARTVELMPGGRMKAVNKHNVIQYVHCVAHQRLNVETATQTKAFLRGFRDLIPASWVRLFSSYELQKLISGDDSIRGIDVESLQNVMQYAAGYHPSQPIIQWFWEIIDDMIPDEQRKFLKFMTSCSRQPLLGFGSLEPAPCIQQVQIPDAVFLENAEKAAPLPTSSTCMNLLKLPNYRTKELMRRKLLAAIESGAGFELT